MFGSKYRLEKEENNFIPFCSIKENAIQEKDALPGKVQIKRSTKNSICRRKSIRKEVARYLIDFLIKSFFNYVTINGCISK